jgi:hypothetical protein
MEVGMKKPQVYVAGPYTGTSDQAILDNCGVALIAAARLIQVGYAPIVPHTMGSHRATWDEAMVRCRMLVSNLDPSRGDCVALLPGWENSRGTREEAALARSLGIPARMLDDVIKDRPKVRP